MKRLLLLLLLAASALLAACAAPAASTWQEQHDLGMRYLTEGNYEEAIIAFTAAIEIDTKRAEAYVGVAKAYVAQGDKASAVEWLQKGMEQASDTSELSTMLEELGADVPAQQGAADSGQNGGAQASGESDGKEKETISVRGTVFWRNQNNEGTLHIRFSEPVTVETDGKTVAVTEAEIDMGGTPQAREFIDEVLMPLADEVYLQAVSSGDNRDFEADVLSVAATGTLDYMDYREVERLNGVQERSLPGDGGYGFHILTMNEG